MARVKYIYTTGMTLLVSVVQSGYQKYGTLQSAKFMSLVTSLESFTRQLKLVQLSVAREHNEKNYNIISKFIKSKMAQAAKKRTQSANDSIMDITIDGEEDEDNEKGADGDRDLLLLFNNDNDDEPFFEQIDRLAAISVSELAKGVKLASKSKAKEVDEEDEDSYNGDTDQEEGTNKRLKQKQQANNKKRKLEAPNAPRGKRQRKGHLLEKRSRNKFIDMYMNEATLNEGESSSKHQNEDVQVDSNNDDDDEIDLEDDEEQNYEDDMFVDLEDFIVASDDYDPRAAHSLMKQHDLL